MSDIVPLLGIETEYGIVREDQEESDPVEESMQLLARCELKSVFRAWAYNREHTHLDMRGFRVSHLAQDEEEDEFCEQDRKRPYSYWEMKSDRVLTNGARFYNDHTHPEYSTPECRTVFDLVTHDLAGEKIVGECVRLRNQDLGGDFLQLFKNNTDYSGHSYGTHDNYLIPRKLPFEVWVRHLVPFLVTRQLYAGAGKIGAERKNEDGFTGLQLAQRADFIDSVLSIETMTQRPIINTRDEPHATQDYRRLHLILGDANMSPYATALKVGTTRLVLTLIGAQKLDAPFELAEPVADVQRVSRDITGATPLQLKSFRPRPKTSWVRVCRSCCLRVGRWIAPPSRRMLLVCGSTLALGRRSTRTFRLLTVTETFEAVEDRPQLAPPCAGLFLRLSKTLFVPHTGRSRAIGDKEQRKNLTTPFAVP
ncbi:MAG: proteasome accessory factor PafA2 family protein [Nitrospinae bacterium]|nr:proteasome accessory factor PafA2 family protein [Nitrospinota bacterium]